MKTGHVGINVTDLDRSIDFYRDIFTLDLLGQNTQPNRRSAFLGHDGTLILTLWQQSDGRFTTNRPGLHHLSFEAPDLTHLHQAETRLRARGATLTHDGIVAHGEGATSGGLFFQDPDGTRLEIYVTTGLTAPAPHADAPTCGFF
ncbi:VOC family protein [Nonomuraea sp. NBC_01738]|uniref:VOC family protein n=1 Tax=Nonomuraea sp. NBC_01738 TaxID=2976003 RepID=UPI002E143E87|nr:VOC family protein [Nonomuraea sp. NBC_01738]